jgi:hypothetical protein
MGSSRLTLTQEALLALAKHTTLGDASKSTGSGSPFIHRQWLAVRGAPFVAPHLPGRRMAGTGGAVEALAFAPV